MPYDINLAWRPKSKLPSGPRDRELGFPVVEYREFTCSPRRLLHTAANALACLGHHVHHGTKEDARYFVFNPRRDLPKTVTIQGDRPVTEFQKLVLGALRADKVISNSRRRYTDNHWEDLLDLESQGLIRQNEQAFLQAK